MCVLIGTRFELKHLSSSMWMIRVRFVVYLEQTRMLLFARRINWYATKHGWKSTCYISRRILFVECVPFQPKADIINRLFIKSKSSEKKNIFRIFPLLKWSQYTHYRFRIRLGNRLMAMRKQWKYLQGVWQLLQIHSPQFVCFPIFSTSNLIIGQFIIYFCRINSSPGFMKPFTWHNKKRSINVAASLVIWNDWGLCVPLNLFRDSMRAQEFQSKKDDWFNHCIYSCYPNREKLNQFLLALNKPFKVSKFLSNAFSKCRINLALIHFACINACVIELSIEGHPKYKVVDWVTLFDSEVVQIWTWNQTICNRMDSTFANGEFGRHKWNSLMDW